MQNMPSKLDWTRMLGFEQIADIRVASPKGSEKLDVKVGLKVGGKLGLKAGFKS